MPEASANPKTLSSAATRSSNLYAEITRAIIGILGKGVEPWQSGLSPVIEGPKELGTNKPFRGLNILLLAAAAYFRGFASPYWLTFNQAKAKGGTVKKGEKSTIVVFWKKCELEDKQSGEEEDVPVVRYDQVFNVEQCEGIPAPDAVFYVPTEFHDIEAAEAIVKGYAGGPAIVHAGQQAFYRPSTDTVCIPDRRRFRSSKEYYSVLFHELAHSSGHSVRLNRGLDTTTTSNTLTEFGREELIAEIASAFLCAEAGIAQTVIENQAAYISGWLGRLNQDKKLIVSVAAASQQAADWICGRRHVGT